MESIDLDIITFKTANEFSLHIEHLANTKRITHLEAVLLFCEQHQVDPDDLAVKINKPLKDKIEQNFRDLNYLPKTVQIEF